jgi:hypothetical protein
MTGKEKVTAHKTPDPTTRWGLLTTKENPDFRDQKVYGLTSAEHGGPEFHVTFFRLARS